MNHKLLTALLILVGIGGFIFDFWAFQNLSFDALDKRQADKALVGVKADQASKVLPDIKKGESIADSQIRNQTIAKIKPTLPYLDPDYGYSIVYYNDSKILSVQIPAKSLTNYREIKSAAEAKLSEMGIGNLCNLVIFWAPPATLNKELTKTDLTTSNCP